MRLIVRMVSRYLKLSVLLAATESVALKVLQPLGVHESARVDELVIEKYNFNNVAFTVSLLFSRNGFSRATMTAVDKRDVFEKIQSALSAQYGKPALQSEYDGDEELTHTTWIWQKSRGKLSLESYETSGIFTVTYDSRR